MKPRIKLAETKTPDGGTLALFEHDTAFAIFLEGKELMHSKVVCSEKLLGTVGVEKLDRQDPGRILIGGLGLGFTLRSVVESVGPDTQIEVAELIPDVIHWNQTHMSDLNGSLLNDPRVSIHSGDVAQLVAQTKPGTYDAIMLDIDNGPVAMVADSNADLYSAAGVRSLCRILKVGGRITLWSAGRDEKFENRLAKAGLSAQRVPAKVHEGAKRATYLLYLIDPDKSGGPGRQRQG
jgi:spermidine synthase